MKPTLLTLTVVLAAFASLGAAKPKARKPAPPPAPKLDQALLMYGRYAECEKSFDEAFAAVKAAGGKLSFATKDKGFKIGNRAITTLRAGRDVKWVLGKPDEVKTLVDYALEKDPGMPKADVFELRLSAALAPLKGPAEETLKLLEEVEPKLAEGVDPKDRLAVIRNCASVASAANREGVVRGCAAYLDKVSPPQPKLVMKVAYSSHPVTGPDSWERLSCKPDEQQMLRNYGGSHDFFATDVTTGERGGATGEMKTHPSIAVVCDDWGVHFRFTDPDEKAKEIELGLVQGGSYEAYLAPGADEPYACFLVYPDDRPVTIMNTLYDCPGHRRIDPTKASKVQSRTIISEAGVVSFVSFSWDNWADKVPEDGTLWDFEAVRWGRAGSAAWNGLKSVHGRSSWGLLRFEMPKAARASILRRQVIRAKNEYCGEKYTTARRTGVFDHWKDAEIGDPAFYGAKLAALEKELDGYAEKVTAEMSDDEVLELAKTALPKWRDVRYTVARIRAAYLAERL